MMTAQYYQLAQALDVILQKVNGIHGLKFIYSAAKKSANRTEQADMNFLESIAKPFFDPFTESRQMFTQWVIHSDVFITNSNFQKDSFLKRFIKQRDKVQTEFDKTKINSTKLAEKIGELRIHLDALEKHGKRVAIVPHLQEKTTPQLDSTIILEKGNTIYALKQVSNIFNNSKGFLKVMDKWVSDRTLEYFASVPEVPIKILTSNIDNKKRISFQVMLNRINETRSTSIEVRICNPKEFHDRYIITGKELWIIGSSLKDAGYKNWTTLNRLEDNEKRKELNKIFDKLWKASVVFTSL